MPEMTRYCADCGGEQPFALHHVTDGICPDSPDGRCAEWMCTGCGAALLIDIATGVAELPRAAQFLSGRRVA